jgi:hypothetical protein
VDFIQYISTPKNTAKTAPLVTQIHLTRGRLTGGFVYFPSGPAGTLHFIAQIGGLQIIPFNKDQDLRLDDCTVPLFLGIDLQEPPFLVDCHTWNDSTEHAHVLTVSFSLDPLGVKKRDIKTLTEGYMDTEGYEKP